MTKRLNRLLAAIAAAATLATGVAGSAWADTADGKVSFDVKAADGTTLDGMDIDLYRVGEWNMDALERDENGTLTGVHAVSTDTDDRAGFQVAEDGTQTAVTPHGRAARAAESAGVTFDASADPLDTVWALGASDTHMKAFAQAYAKELADAKATPDATSKGAGDIRLDPGVYVAMRGTDADSAVLAGTATADGSVIEGRADMGSVTLRGDAVPDSDETASMPDPSDQSLWSRLVDGVKGLLDHDSEVAVQDVGASAGVNGYGGSGGSNMEWRWWFQDTAARTGNALEVAMGWGGWGNVNRGDLNNINNITYTRNQFTDVCNSAKDNAIKKYGHDRSYYRIVAVGAFLGTLKYANGASAGKGLYNGNPGNNALQNAFNSAWNAGGKNEMQAQTNDRNAYLNYVVSLAHNATNGPVKRACVVLGKDQPAPPKYRLDISTQAGSFNKEDSRESDMVWLQDTVKITARDGNWPAGAKTNVTTQLVYDPTPDGVNPDGSVQADNKSDRKVVEKTVDWSLSNGLPKDHTETFYSPWFKPEEMFGSGKGWQYGRYWFYVKVSPGAGNTHMAASYYEHFGYADGSEGFNRTLVTGKTVAKAKANGSWTNLSDAKTAAGLIGTNAPLRDYVNLSGTYPRYKADSSNGNKRQTFTVKQTLHHRATSGKTTDSAVKTFSYAYNEKTPSFADQNSPEFTPSDLGMKDGWDAGDYWFDNVIEGHLTENSVLTSNTNGWQKNTETPGEASVVRTWHSHGQTEENEHWTVAQPAAPTITTKAMAGSAKVGGTQPVHDSITVTNSDPSRAVTIAKVTTTLHMRTGNRSASKTVGPVTIPAGGSKTFDSNDFVPSDLKRKCWSNGRYWFDANISAADATYPSGAKALTSDLVHDGKSDTNQSFNLTMDSLNGFSTQAQDTFSTAGGTSATHDRLLLTTDPDSVAEDLSVKVTLNWNASATGTTATKTSTKADVFPAGSAYKDLKGFTPTDLGMANGWLAGRYWYDVVIPAQDGIDDTITLNGLKKDVAKESWVVAEPTAALTTKTDAPADLTDLSATAVHDTVTAKTTGYPANSTFAATLTLNYRAADGTTAKAKPVAFKAAVNGSTKSPDVAPSAFGWTKWRIGHYWFDLSAVDPNGKTVTVPGANDANERFDVAEHKSSGFTTKTDAPANLTDQSATAVHDTVTAKTTGYPAGTTFAATLTLNHAASAGAAADASKSLALKVNVNGATKSGDFTPALFGWKTWRVGHYWFDLTVTVDGKAVSVPGANDANERFDVANHTTKATLAITTQAAKGTASTANADPVHDTVRLASAGAALTVARVHVRLNYPKADGTTATAVKDTGAVKVPANGAASVDSPTFTPADLGMGDLWADNTAGTNYWFDVWADGNDVTLTTDTGVLKLGGSLSHEGKADAAEQFRLDKQTGKATTTAAGTFARAGGTAATHDVLHLAFPGAKTLKATSTLHYAANAAAVKADVSRAKTVTVAANGDVAGPTFTPADFGWSAWKAGRYWYDLDIPTQAGYNALAVDGLTDKAEQWTAVVPYTLDLAKLAYIGQPGQGRWSNEPVKGATFTLTETTDGTGSTAKPGASPKTVTTDANGSAHLLDGTIGATGARWFKLVETRTPASYAKPSTGTYWMVKVAGGADKAAVTVAGSNAEAKALLKGLDGTTVTVGNRLEGNIIPPMTGGRYDVARAGALAGLVTLGLLAAGVMALRRRDSDPNR